MNPAKKVIEDAAHTTVGREGGHDWRMQFYEGEPLPTCIRCGAIDSCNEERRWWNPHGPEEPEGAKWSDTMPPCCAAA